MVNGLGDDELLVRKISRGSGYLVSIGGPMDAQKTSHAVLAAYWATKSQVSLAYSFKPSNSVRSGIDEGASGLRARSGLSLDGTVVPYDQPEKILAHMIERDCRIMVVDECHMFAGMGLRPVIKAATKLHRFGVYAISLTHDFGDHEIPISAYLDEEAIVRFQPTLPFCHWDKCWERAKHNQLLQGDSVVPYAGFKAISGDVKPTEGEQLRYQVYCDEHFTAPKVVDGYEHPAQLIPPITDLERAVIDRMKTNNLIPADVTEEYLTS